MLLTCCIIGIACPSKSGNWSSDGSITQEDTSLCNTWRNLQEDFLFTEVHLRGSLAGLNYSAAELYNDLFELSQYHYEISNLTSLTPFDIRYLSTIMGRANDMTDIPRKPSIYMEVEHSLCTSPAIRNITSPLQVSGNTVHFAPPYDANIDKIFVRVKSIQTQSHHIRFIWEQQVLQFTIQAYAAAVEEEPDYSMTADITAVVSIPLGPIILPGHGGGFDHGDGGPGPVVIQSNGNITSETILELSDSSFIIPPSLSKGVYTCGKTDESVKWQAPILYEIKENTL